MAHAFDLSQTPLHLPFRQDQPVAPVEDFGFAAPDFETYIQDYTTPNEPGRLIMMETSADDWSHWECHPLGDEIVIIVEGRGVFFQDFDGDIAATPFSPGATIINPAGIWHTADIVEPMRAIYLTPVPDTQHKPRDA